MIDIKKAYSELKKKNDLPSFDEIDSLFEISALDSEQFLLRNIRRKITDTLEYYLKLLEEVLHPETTLAAMHEQRFFTEDDRKHYITLYKRLMIIHRKSLEVALLQDDEAHSAFIRDVFKVWPSLQKELLGLVKKLQGYWQEEDVQGEGLGYFG